MHDSAVNGTDGQDSPNTLKPLSVDVPGAAVLMGCGQRHVWSLIKTGDLPSFKYGRVRRVRVTDIEVYLDDLVEEDRQTRVTASA